MKSEKGNNKSKIENNPFSMPDDYFNAFSKKMMFKIELAEELKEFKILSSIDKKSPFSTPLNYFESKAELAEYSRLMSIRNKHVFAVPENYFYSSASSIINKLEVMDEVTSYPFIASVSKENSFTVPDMYFDKLSEQIVSGIKVMKQNGHGRIMQLVFNRKTVYAIAAILVLSFGLYLYNSNADAVSADCNTLACLERNEIINQNHLINFDDDALTEIVNTEELSKNINAKLKEEHLGDNEQQSTEDYILENTDVNEITDEI